MPDITPETKRLLILCVTIITITSLGLCAKVGDMAAGLGVVTGAFAGLFGIINANDK